MSYRIFPSLSSVSDWFTTSFTSSYQGTFNGGFQKFGNLSKLSEVGEISNNNPGKYQVKA